MTQPSLRSSPYASSVELKKQLSQALTKSGLNIKEYVPAAPANSNKLSQIRAVNPVTFLYESYCPPATQKSSRGILGFGTRSAVASYILSSLSKFSSEAFPREASRGDYRKIIQRSGFKSLSINDQEAVAKDLLEQASRGAGPKLSHVLALLVVARVIPDDSRLVILGETTITIKDFHGRRQCLTFCPDKVFIYTDPGSLMGFDTGESPRNVELDSARGCLKFEYHSGQTSNIPLDRVVFVEDKSVDRITFDKLTRSGASGRLGLRIPSRLKNLSRRLSRNEQLPNISRTVEQALRYSLLAARCEEAPPLLFRLICGSNRKSTILTCDDIISWYSNWRVGHQISLPVDEKAYQISELIITSLESSGWKVDENMNTREGFGIYGTGKEFNLRMCTEVIPLEYLARLWDPQFGHLYICLRSRKPKTTPSDRETALKIIFWKMELIREHDPHHHALVIGENDDGSYITYLV